MRRSGVLGSTFIEILFWSEAGKGSVRSVVIVEVLEAVEDWVEGFDGFGEIVGFVELIAPGAVAAFNGPVEFGRFGRQDEELDVVVLALRSAVDLDGFDLEGHVA